MQFTVSSSELQKHISAVSGVVPPKSVLPIIQNIHFELKEGSLQLTATDLENTIQTALAVEAAPGAVFNVALPSKLLQDTLKALPEQPLKFSVAEGSFLVKITTDNGEYKINGQNGQDFPRLPQGDNTNSINMPLGVLIKAISNTLFAASTDELKPAMTGLFFQFEKNGATFVATDAHRLVRYRRLDVTVDNEVSFILPRKALQLLSSAGLGSADESVKIEYNDKNAFFKFGATALVCRLIDAHFPDYKNVIPASSPNKVIINKKDLVGTMKRLDIYSSKSTHLGRFKFSGNLLEVQAEDSDFAYEAKETLHCLYEGEELEIGFNISLMVDLIANADTDEVIIELDTPGRSAVILPGDQQTGENVLMLLMPVMLATSY